MTFPRPVGPTLDELVLHDAFVRRLARSLLGDAAAAEDVAQDAWRAAIDKPPRHAANPKAWLARVVRRLASKARRGEGRRAKREAAVARPEATASTVAEIAERESVRAELVAAVLRLEDPYRETTLLRHFQGCDVAEIARRTGATPVAVRKRLSVALAKLRVALDADRPDARARWIAALTPLAAPTWRGVATAGATEAGGALLMTTKAKAATTCAAALLAAAIWRAAVGGPEAPEAPAFGAGADSATTVAPAATREGPATASSAEGVATAPTADGAVRRARFADRAVSAFGSLRVRATRDGAPAAGVAFTVFGWGASDPELRGVRAVTDDAGEARFARVPVGAATVGADVGVTEAVEIVAGTEASLEINLDGGYEIVGLVVDDGDVPVADASVMVSGRPSEFPDPPTVRTDRAGTFRVAGVSGRAFVAARASGRGASEATSVEGGTGTRVDVTLRLRGRGGRVVGRVLLPDGGPAAGARVAIHERPPTPASAPAEARTPEPPSPAATTIADAEGRFAADGVRVGGITVEARAPRTAVATVDADVVADAEVVVELKLRAGAILEGVVLRPDGAPAAGAAVCVGALGSLGALATRADDAGAYRLDGVAPGSLAVEAELAGVGAADAVLHGLTDGATARWDAKLDPGPTLRVRVVDEAGLPVPGAEIEIVRDGLRFGAGRGASFAGARSDRDGRATLTNLAAGRFTVRVFDPAGPRGAASSATASGATNGPEVEVVLHSGRARCMVVGRVVDAAGAPLASVELRASREGADDAIRALSDRDGRFRLGPLSAGRVRPTYHATGFGRGDLGVRDLVPGETWDLGDVVLAAPGVLEARVGSRRASDRSTWPWVNVRSTLGDADVTGEAKDGVARFELAPGTYAVALLGWSCDGADDETTVVVRSGATTTVALEAATGALVRVRLRTATPPAGTVAATVDVFDAGGRAVCRRRTWAGLGGGPRFADVELRLTPGSYVLRGSFLNAAGESTLAVSAADVAAGDAASTARAPVVLDLK